MEIIQHLSELKRQKIYILNYLEDNLSCVKDCLISHKIKTTDIGLELASFLADKYGKKHLDIIVTDYIEKIIDKNAEKLQGQNHKIVAIENIGILLEPSLKLDAEKLLADISKNTHLFVLWSGESDGQGLLYWSNQKEKFNFNFTQYQPLIINYENEI